jgi:uncharacterized membrane protein
MTLFNVAILTATLLCSLVAGFLFAFATVVMPGIGRLDDRGFIRAFQAVDGVIQANQPLFIVVWVGSAVSVVVAGMLGIWELEGTNRLLLSGAALLYVFGVQVPTISVNIPLNNQLQRLDPDSMNDSARQRARSDFERSWNRWNVFRTICASVVAIGLCILLLRV